MPLSPGLPPAIFIAAETLGLGTIRSGTAGPTGFADDLDAMDILPPGHVPALPTVALGALALCLLATASWGLARRRRPRAV